MENIRYMGNMEKTEIIMKLYNEGKTPSQIQKVTKLEKRYIDLIINMLLENGKIKPRKQIIEERREAVGQLLDKKQNKERSILVQEISMELGITIKETIEAINFVERVRRQNKIIETRRNQIQELCKTKEISMQEMAEELNVSISTIRTDIAELRKQGKTIEPKREMSIHKKKQKDLGRLSSLSQRIKNGEIPLTVQISEDFENYITTCKSRFSEGTFEKSEMPILKKVVTVKNNYSDIMFYLRACTHFKYIREVKGFTDLMLDSTNFTEEQKEKMKDANQKADNILKRATASEAIKKGLGVEEAVRQSGLDRNIVVQINKKIMSKPIIHKRR